MLTFQVTRARRPIGTLHSEAALYKRKLSLESKPRPRHRGGDEARKVGTRELQRARGEAQRCFGVPVVTHFTNVTTPYTKRGGRLNTDSGRMLQFPSHPLGDTSRAVS